MVHYAVSIIGNVREVRTEAEIERGILDGASALVSVVYDSANGWITEVTDEALAEEPDKDFLDAIAQAQESLSHYVNRRGEDPPEGLTAAGLSLWLMETDDGTAMGQPLSG